MFGNRIALAALTDERAKCRTVVAVQPDLGTDPQKSIAILRYRQRTQLRQTIDVSQAAKARCLGTRLGVREGCKKDEGKHPGPACAEPKTPQRAWNPHNAILPQAVLNGKAA